MYIYSLEFINSDAIEEETNVGGKTDIYKLEVCFVIFHRQSTRKFPEFLNSEGLRFPNIC